MSDKISTKKIYTIYENKLHALGVRETPKKFIEINPNSAGRPFGFKQHCYKNEYSTSAIGAIERAAKKERRGIKISKELMKRSELNLIKLKKLLKEHAE